MRAIASASSDRELVERQRRFIQDASHQLRTPITVALGHAERVLARAQGALRADAAVVVDELMRLRRLSDDLLVLATADDADFLLRVPIEVEVIVLEALRRWSPASRRWSLGPVVEATVAGDRDRLALALDALLENAVNHTRSGDTIELSARLEGERVVIAIADTGTGIRSGDPSRLFERFARAGDGRERSGSGLGLAIVKAIAEAHCGRARARSGPSGGSVFELLLPVAPAR